MQKDYSNDGNLYNKTFFDIYCHCKQRHSEVGTSNFMLQCFNCEDWFHNHHLLPPILSKTIGDEYILICRACIPKVGASILPYIEFMEKGCSIVFQEHYGVTQESSQKRRKLDDISKEEPVLMKKSCENYPQESTA